MMYLDLAELYSVFNGRLLWSTRRPALARFRREDHFGDANIPLDNAIRTLVEGRTGNRPDGPIRLLTSLRYFGYCFNPVSYYYCFSKDGVLSYIVAEVHNTPWGEEHVYVLNPLETAEATDTFYSEADKEMHVSPFMDMDMRYQFHISTPKKHLRVCMNVLKNDERFLEATLSLKRHEITAWTLLLTLVKFPFMTQQIIFKIYWQALRLRLKHVPFYAHPEKGD